MVGTTRRNSVEADDQQETEKVGPDENTEHVMQLYSLSPYTLNSFSLQNKYFLPVKPAELPEGEAEGV